VPRETYIIDKTAVLRILEHMITMSSTEARNNFGEFLDKGSREPVIVKRQNREVGAFVPMRDLEKLRQIGLKELRQSVKELSDEARSNGLTEKILNEILEEVNPS
jgi:prevent-host-death family protein